MIKDKRDDKFEKLLLYYKKNINVHLILKSTEWLNGILIEVEENYIMINEFKKGVMPVLMNEISEIAPYIEK